MEPQQPSGHRPEGFCWCCSIMVGRDVCHYCEVDDSSDPLDRQCMLTAVVLRQCSSVRLSTAVQGDISSTMHDLVMLIASAHQSSCAVSVRTCGRCSIKRQSVAAAHRRVWSWCRECRESLRGHDRARSYEEEAPKTAVSGYQLAAAHARRPQHHSAQDR